jgi:hypothetical protein
MNPWEDMFNAWLTALSPTQEKKMKRYGITFTAPAKIYIEIDAPSSDEAVDIAWDFLDETRATFDDWEVEDVDMVDSKA